MAMYKDEVGGEVKRDDVAKKGGENTRTFPSTSVGVQNDTASYPPQRIYIRGGYNFYFGRIPEYKSISGRLEQTSLLDFGPAWELIMFVGGLLTRGSFNRRPLFVYDKQDRYS